MRAARRRQNVHFATFQDALKAEQATDILKYALKSAVQIVGILLALIKSALVVHSFRESVFKYPIYPAKTNKQGGEGCMYGYGHAHDYKQCSRV